VAQKEAHTERVDKTALFNLMPAEFTAMGKKRVEEFTKAQTELLDKLQETNRKWFERMQSEANLASEFASRLTAVRSIPDAMIACQEWTSRRLEMMAEDGKHLLADCQKFTETGARLCSNGWASNRGEADG
jgi:Phasin protein